MSQGFRVLRCFNCKMYQVDMMKKSHNWKCKICNERQSVHCEIFRGTSAECRVKTQQLNLNRGEEAQVLGENVLEIMMNDVQNNMQSQPTARIPRAVTATQNKWDVFNDHTTVAQIHHENTIEDNKQTSLDQMKNKYTPYHLNATAPMPLQSMNGNTIAYESRMQETMKRKTSTAALDANVKRSKWEDFL